MIANPCFHCWRHAQTLMNPAEVVVHVMERNRVLQILHLFAKSVRQSRESAHSHSHSQILALSVAGRNVIVVRITANHRAPRTHALSGRVTRLWGQWLIAIKFNQHRVVNLSPESLIDRDQVSSETVRGQLHAICKALLQVAKEMVSRCRVSWPDKPARDKFCVAVNSNPSPSISAALHALFCRCVLFLRVNKRPNLVALDSAAFQIAKHPVLILRASAAKIAEQFNNRVLGNACYSDGSADAVSLDQTRNSLCSFFGAQLIHGGHYA